MKPIVTFGEVMGRFAPSGFLRLRQALPGPLDLTFGGAEACLGVLSGLAVSQRSMLEIPSISPNSRNRSST